MSDRAAIVYTAIQDFPTEDLEAELTRRKQAACSHMLINIDDITDLIHGHGSDTEDIHCINCGKRVPVRLGDIEDVLRKEFLTDGK